VAERVAAAAGLEGRVGTYLDMYFGFGVGDGHRVAAEVAGSHDGLPGMRLVGWSEQLAKVVGLGDAKSHTAQRPTSVDERRRWMPQISAK